MAPYAINADGVVRTPLEALELARANGINIPEDVNIGFMKNWTRADADAEYFYNPNSYKPSDWIDWEDFYHPETGQIPVRVNASLLNSDEALVAHIGHEMYEINSLRDVFEEAGGSLQARQLNRLIAPRENGGLINNLHEQAWDEADRLVWKMRNGDRQ
jgi:hypothetical protein